MVTLLLELGGDANITDWEAMECPTPPVVPKEVYYDDLILPLNLCIQVDESRAKTNRHSYKPSTSSKRKMNERKPSICCDSCRSGTPDYSSPDSDAEPTAKSEFSCPHCELTFSLSIALKHHIRTKHPITATDKNFRCSYCSFGSDELPVMRRHVREVHWSEKRHQCPHCKYRAKRSTHLRRHMEARHGALLQPDESAPTPPPVAVAPPRPVVVKSLFCDQCDFATSNPRSLKRHTRKLHGRQIPLHCESCDYTATQSRELRHHVKTVHENAKAYECPCCSYRTVHLGSLKNHIMARHTGEKSHQCPHCPYKAVQSGNLKRHLLTKHPNKKAKR